MLFTGKYLRVLTPRTIDGSTPQLDENGTLVYKEDSLPLTARRDLEIQNKGLPDILKKKIEEVGEPNAQQIVKEKNSKK